MVYYGTLVQHHVTSKQRQDSRQRIPPPHRQHKLRSGLNDCLPNHQWFSEACQSSWAVWFWFCTSLKRWCPLTSFFNPKDIGNQKARCQDERNLWVQQWDLQTVFHELFRKSTLYEWILHELTRVAGSAVSSARFAEWLRTFLSVPRMVKTFILQGQKRCPKIARKIA